MIELEKQRAVDIALDERTETIRRDGKRNFVGIIIAIAAAILSPVLTFLLASAHK